MKIQGSQMPALCIFGHNCVQNNATTFVFSLDAKRIQSQPFVTNGFERRSRFYANCISLRKCPIPQKLHFSPLPRGLGTVPDPGIKLLIT
jgi:hypothetical protein